jgi:hypothetical protein
MESYLKGDPKMQALRSLLAVAAMLASVGIASAAELSDTQLDLVVAGAGSAAAAAGTTNAGAGATTGGTVFTPVVIATGGTTNAASFGQ